MVGSVGDELLAFSCPVQRKTNARPARPHSGRPCRAVLHFHAPVHRHIDDIPTTLMSNPRAKTVSGWTTTELASMRGWPQAGGLIGACGRGAVDLARLQRTLRPPG